MDVYGLSPEAVDAVAMDRAYTEETVRRAVELAENIYIGMPDGKSMALLTAQAEELCNALVRLGVHLDGTYGTGITYGAMDGPPPWPPAGPVTQ